MDARIIGLTHSPLSPKRTFRFGIPFSFVEKGEFGKGTTGLKTKASKLKTPTLLIVEDNSPLG